MNFRWVVSCGWLLFWGWASAAGAVELPAWGDYHPWRRFPPGSWSLVELKTETITADGRPTETSTTRTRTTLKEVAANTYTLLIQSSVELGGREMESPPQTLTKGLWGDAASVVTVRESSPVDPFELPDRLVPVRRFEVEVMGDTTVCRHVIDFSHEQSPFTLHRTIECFARADHAPLYSTRVSTLNVDLPYRLGDRVLAVAYVQTLQKLKQGETLTLETFSREIPGGVTSHTSKELGAKGELLRRSTMQLIEYHVAAEPGSTTREVGADLPEVMPVRPQSGQAPAARGATSSDAGQFWPVTDAAERGKRVPWRERTRHRSRSR